MSIGLRAPVFTSNNVSKCDAGHSVNRGGPTQWVYGKSVRGLTARWWLG
jgi:hypothetical protein